MLEKQCKKQKIESERLLIRMNNAERNANSYLKKKSKEQGKNSKREMNRKAWK